MDCGEPLCKQCSCCVPLKIILIIWAVLKTIGLGVAEMYFIVICMLLSQYGEAVLAFIPLIVLMFVDSIALIYLVVAVCKNSYKLVRVFYIYHYFVIAIEFLVILMIYIFVFEPVEFNNEWIFMIIGSSTFLILELCILKTVHSVMLKLREKEQYGFAKMAGAAISTEETSNYKLQDA